MWGVSTRDVSTFGSNDTSCPGSSIVQSKSQPSTAPDSPTHINIGLIVGITVGVTVFMCIILVISFWYWHRRRGMNEARTGVWDTRDILANAWDPPSPPSTERHPMSERSPPQSSAPFFSPSTYTGVSSDVFSPLSLISDISGPASSSTPNLTTVASTSDLSSSRIRTAGPQNLRPNWHRYGSSASSSQGSLTLSQLPLGAAPSLASRKHEKALGSDAHPSVIIQHLDGGTGGVQELPPPYIGQSNAVSTGES